jgi:hypothetical protein
MSYVLLPETLYLFSGVPMRYCSLLEVSSEFTQAAVFDRCQLLVVCGVLNHCVLDLSLYHALVH